MNDKNKKVTKLKNQFVRELPSKIETLHAAWDSFLTKGDKHDLGTIRRISHNLAGISGVFGYYDLGGIASQLDEMCDKIQRDSKLSVSDSKLLMTPLITDLIQYQYSVTGEEDESYELEDNAESEHTDTDESNINIILVEDEEIQAALIKEQLKPRGYTVTVYKSTEEASKLLERTQPAAILMDIMLGKNKDAGIHFVQTLKNQHIQDVPVFFISSRNDIEAHLNAVRAGGKGYFVKPVDIDLLATKLDEVTSAYEKSKYRVLIIEDDHIQAETYKQILEPAGLQIGLVTDPVKAMESLYSIKPDLIISDLHMPKIDGFQLASMIRQDSKFASIPIIFLSAEENPHKRQLAIHLGADDFMQKPVNPTSLLKQVRQRLAQGRTLKNKLSLINQKNPLTGPFNNQGFYSALVKTISEVKAGQQQAALIYVEIDDYDELQNYFSGPNISITDVISSLFLQHLDINDTIARLSERHIAILKTVIDTEEAVSIAQSIQQLVESRPVEIGTQAQAVTISIGIAPIDRYALDTHSVLHDAIISCDIAKKKTRDRLHTYDPIKDVNSIEDKGKLLAGMVAKAIKEDSLRLGYFPITCFSEEHTGLIFSTSLQVSGDTNNEISSDFLYTVAERSGIVLDIDQWIVETITQEALKLRSDGKDVKIFTRISALSICNPKFIDWLTDYLDKFKTAVGALVFDVGLDTAKEKLKDVITFFNIIKSHGHQIALSNICNTRESMKFLKLFSIDYIIIGGCLIKDLTIDAKKQEILKDISISAHTADIKTIAAYAEDVACMATLYQCDVDYLQGHTIETID